jgi:hypothetical protein
MPQLLSPLFVFSFFILIAIGFQLALTLGAPWGEYAMAGKFPGKFPFKMRMVSFFQSLILAFFLYWAWIRSGSIENHLNIPLNSFWVVVVFFSLGTVMNFATPSRKERKIWGPVNLILLVSGLAIALG